MFTSKSVFTDENMNNSHKATSRLSNPPRTVTLTETIIDKDMVYNELSKLDILKHWAQLVSLQIY